MSQACSTDVLIVGGGIAGLWLNARLRQQGFSTVLVEQNTLGGGQSVKSQGIIHGGTKYALQGALTGASEAIADMPSRWRAALAGQGELDLSGVRCLSDAHYLWSPGSLAGNLTSFFASKAVRSRVSAAKGDDLPPALQSPKFKGKAYKLSELVLDVPSLIQRLAELSGDSLWLAQSCTPLWLDDQLAGLSVNGVDINAQRVVICAGEGTAELLAQLGQPLPQMQRRPLHMVMVKSANLKPLYAHCLGAGSKPRITVTSHPAADGEWVWYLGGQLAEADGVARDSAEQIHFAQAELAQLVPWIDLSQAKWATLRVNRAEPAQSSGARPDNAFLHYQNHLFTAWPTKLALAPDLSDRVIESLQNQGVQPQEHTTLPEHQKPPVAAAFWEGLV